MLFWITPKYVIQCICVICVPVCLYACLYECDTMYLCMPTHTHTHTEGGQRTISNGPGPLHLLCEAGSLIGLRYQQVGQASFWDPPGSASHHVSGAPVATVSFVCGLEKSKLNFSCLLGGKQVTNGAIFSSTP